MHIFYTSSLKPEYADVYEVVKQAVKNEGHEITVWDGLLNRNEDLSEYAKILINSNELIIADVSESSSAVFFQLGYARSLEKPIICIARKDKPINHISSEFLVLFYDRKRINETLAIPLLEYLSAKLPADIAKDVISKREKGENLKTVFVSYSHVDVSYLNRLKVHMRPFEKNNRLDFWVDTKIKAGEQWKEKIQLALEKSAIAILLISADFLASDFIVDNELPPLLKAAEQKGKVILPVILKPCRFTKHETLSKFQAVNDPSIPMSKLDENDREEIYVKIADLIDSMI